MSKYVSLEHDRFKTAQVEIFTSKVTPDCMSHRCKLLNKDNKEKLEACCSYGVDVDLRERENILNRKSEIKNLLDIEVRDTDWFSSEEKLDSDFPSGRFVRTKKHGDGCLFLAHDKRGCAIHRAAIEGDWDFRGTKPHVCRLFPVSYESESIVVSDDYSDYSCSQDDKAPTLYQVAREDLKDIFGETLVVAMDKVEKLVAARKLNIISSSEQTSLI